MNRKTFLKQAVAGAAVLGIGRVTGLAETPCCASADPLSNWSGVRELFPLGRERTYLNTGGLGPASRPVLTAMRERAERQATEGETHHDDLDRIRGVVAAFFGAEPEEIAFTRNATESNSIIAAGLRLERGDEVIFESHAHPGGSFPWMVRQKENGIRVKIFEPDAKRPENNLDRIFELVTPRTRVIQVSHITAPTGILFDVPAIAREARRRGIWFHVDGAQSAGMIPVNLGELGCDSYATSGHKWLNGPQETGVLHIRKECIDKVACSHAGAYSDAGYELPDKFSYNPTVQRHEYGTRDSAAVAGLEAALLLQEKIGRGRIARHGKRLCDLAREQLEKIPGVEILTPSHPAMYHAILTFRVPGLGGSEAASRLNIDHRLRCRNVSERGLNAVRVSWHLYNAEEEVEQVAKAVRSLAGKA